MHEFRNIKNLGRASTTTGFTLVEVLIALVVLSVGMLGVAGLFVHSMQAGRVSIFRQHAVTLASDVADRIRANPRAGAVYALDETADNCVAVAINCTPAEMAGNDIALWKQQAGQSLPAGAAVDVQFNNGVVPPLYQITVSWPEPGQQDLMSYSVTIPVFGF